MNLPNLKRIFIHELGHYTAHTLNLELSNTGAGVAQIWLQEQSGDNFCDYSGGTTPKVPKNHVNDGQIRNKPEYIGALLYGCIFQNIYESKDRYIPFNECFCQESDKQKEVRAHGKIDYSNFHKYLGQKIWPEIMIYVEQEYIGLLRQNIDHFEPLFNLEILEYINVPSKLMYVDLEKLDSNIRPFLETHKKFYASFLTEINQRIKNVC